MFTECVTKIKKSVFFIIFFTTDGDSYRILRVATGFMYSPKFIVTVAHGFLDLPKDICISVVAADDNDDQSEGFLVKLNSDLDIAVIRICRRKASKTIKLSKNIFPEGTKCGHLGFPNAKYTKDGFCRRMKFQSAHVACAPDLQIQKENNQYEIDSITYPGSSGAPVFTEDGEVLGMVSGSVGESFEDQPEERTVFTRCVSSLDILEFCKDIKYRKKSKK